MVRKVCLDSDVIIELLEGNEPTISMIKEIDASFVTTSVNVFEIWYGKEKQEGVEEFINQIENINITKEIGIKTAEILKELKKKGLLVEFRDVFIASACIINNIELLTNNRKHFERIKSFGLKLI